MPAWTPTSRRKATPARMNFATGESATAKAWNEIWCCGQGIGATRQVVPAAERVARLKRETAEARARLLAG